MARTLRTVLATTIAFLAFAGAANAAGGNYVFDGGTRAEQAQVRSALNASSFDWNLVPQQITIHIGHGSDSEALPGEIWLDADLLDAGQFSWGVVQHEYAHQVDFFLLDPVKRAALQSQLGVQAWCYGAQTLAHAAYGCERFASTLAWAYWQTKANSMRPASSADEAGAMKPAAFRALLAGLIGARVVKR